ncbi:aminopeptidase P family protein [Treponema sp. OMZ 792]|uniref:aminopeptidase P family protein n=1 Tax=unclassified Treponema TaxID=2638727 RepID=UPI0020A57FE6|nr:MULTISPECIES: aminopeptidase P family protein [unclassified Treponema]UTC76235.1 aminopeptidase P family protein [Treponema sp. OMZ 792]UTC80236.1 aminopeptidase P family protein [Treponema sp. OMZ 798]
MNIRDRVAALRQKMKEHSLSAYLIPSSDPHQSEYLPENYKTREFISGFTGSAGTVLVTKDKAILWTDGRYFLQAEKQLEGSGIELYKMMEPGVPTVNEFLKSALKPGEKLGMDGRVVSVYSFDSMQKELGGIELVTDIDLIGEIWKDRPQAVLSEAFILEEKYTGKSAKEKIEEVRYMLTEKKADSTVIGALEDVCYLFNVRGRDVRCNPVVTAYAIVDKTRAIIFISSKQLTDEVKSYFASQGVTVMGYEDVFAEAAKLTGKVYIDPSRTNVYLYSQIKANVEKGLNLTSTLKAIKNAVELKNFDDAMEKDGAAMVKILKWVEENAGKGITEWDVSEKLLKFRAEGKDFLEESFETISGYGPNGAIIHYAPSPAESAKLQPKSFLLLDSGGQYLNGTTDITRTIKLGELTEQEKTDYTLVLKAHISLARAKFKAGTTGHAIDTIPREHLWARGRDYKHGTGHGVGYVLSVHEGPQSISSRFLDVPMKLGMVTSNEPGLYVAGSHGIRIESLIVTTEFAKTDDGEFYQFKTITLCPIDTRPIVPGILSDEDINWLNEYHKEVRERLSPYLDEAHKAFLVDRTKAI